MKVTKAKGSQERTILIAMIVSRSVCGAVANRWSDIGMFSTRWFNLVAGWCVDYYRKYKKAPGKNIQPLFDEWSRSNRKDKETVDTVERFIASLSGEYQNLKAGVNPDFVLDLCNNHFTAVKLRQLQESIEGLLEDGDISEANEIVHKYSKVDLGLELGVDVFGDANMITEAFESRVERLIDYEHGLEVFYGDSLERDGFIAYMGPEKRGKTWMLLDVAWNAAFQGRKVAFFEVGDMSRNQIMRRFMVRAAGIPTKPRKVKWPLSIVYEEDDKIATVEHETKTFKEGLTAEAAVKAAARMQKLLQLKEGETNLRLSVHPNSSLSVAGINSILDIWQRNDWTPDVVVIDYADILAPLSGSADTRDQINATWKGLRSLSQSRHCLVVTATQAAASSYSLDTITKSQFSEDKRKLAHVTGMIGLNCNNEEKENGILRLNWIVRREEDFNEMDCCHVATCFALANPTVLSVMN